MSANVISVDGMTRHNQRRLIPDGPWKTVGANLFAFQGRDYLMLVNYYSGFIEVGPMVETTSKAIIAKLRQQFARRGISLMLLTDIIPQFVSKEACQFSNEWEFEHSTSSPYYPQSNGKAESAVKVVKPWQMVKILGSLCWTCDIRPR